MRRRFDKLVASFLAVVLCVAFVPLIAIAQNPSEDLTDAGLVTTTESSTDPVVTTPTETPENANGGESSKIIDPPVVETPTGETTVEEETAEEKNDGVEEEENSEDLIAPQLIEGVASINGAPYDTLQAAVDAADGGITINLNQDVTECITVSSAKSFVLDLGNHTIDANYKGSIFKVTASNCDIEIKNGKLVNGASSSSSYGHAVHLVNGNNFLVLTDMEILESNPNKTGYVVKVGTSAASNKCAVTLNRCNISQARGGVSIFTSGNVTIENTNISKIGAPSGMDSDYEPVSITGKDLTTQVRIVNSNIFENAVVKSGYRSTLSIDAATAVISGCNIYNNSVKQGCAGIFKGSKAKLTLNATVVKNNKVTGKNTSTNSKVYSGGIGALSSDKTEVDLTIESGAIYNNTNNGNPSDLVYIGNKAKYYTSIGKSIKDKVYVLPASNMSDINGGLSSSYFQSYGYEWSIGAIRNVSETVIETISNLDKSIAINGSKLDNCYTGNVSYTGTGFAEITYYATKTTEPVPIAVISNGEEFLSLSKAFDAAQSNDTVSLLFKDGADKSVAIAVDESEIIKVKDRTTFDAVGGYTSGNVDFEVGEGSTFTLDNSGDGLSGNTGFIINNKGYVTLKSGIDVGSIKTINSGLLRIEGLHGDINVNAENEWMVIVGEDFDAKSLNITLPSNTLKMINDGLIKNDIDIVECSSEEQAEKLIENNLVNIIGKTNGLAKLIAKDNKISIHLNAASAIYIGGQQASDNNDGLTPETPVASFDKAKELLDKTTGLQDRRIRVVGEINVDSDQAWSLEDSELIRYKDYSGAYIKIASGNSLKLSNIILNGGSNAKEARDFMEQTGNSLNKPGIQSATPLIIIDEGASLTINDNALLHSNDNCGSMRGGAIYNAGTLVINGGTISDNKTIESGGAIYNLGGVTAVNGGVIEHNKSVRWDGAAKGRSTSSGGGICIAIGSLEINGGEISKNETTGYLGYGGGIALGDCTDRSNQSLTMKMRGGLIKGNTSYGNGGGIAVWSGGKADILGGVIEENGANYGTNVVDAQDSYWGGGGIYIEKNATVHLENVEITGNGAPDGSAIACCPTSDMKVFIKNGAVIHDNNGSAPDLSIYSYWDDRSPKNNIPVSVSKFTPTGVNHNWLKGGKDGKLLAATDDMNRILQCNNKENLFLYSQLTGEDASKAVESCKLHIKSNWSGKSVWNSSYKGGGIGCNGSLTIGNPDTNFVLEKRLSEDSSDQVIKDILGEDIENVEFEFEITFTDPEGNAYANKNIEYYKQGELFCLDTNADGKAAVKLKKDEHILVKGLPGGVKYDVTEKTFNSFVNVTSSVVVVESDKSVNTDVTELLTDYIVGGGNEYGLNEVIIKNEYALSGFDIEKELQGDVFVMNNGTGTSTAVFHVEGFASEDDAKAGQLDENNSRFYDNYVSLNFTKGGTARLSLRDLPVGAWFKITEVSFEGDGHHIDDDSNSVKIFKLEKAQTGEEGTEPIVQTFKFTNIADNDETPNTGIINRYSFSAGGSNVEQIRNSQAA